MLQTRRKQNMTKRKRHLLTSFGTRKTGRASAFFVRSTPTVPLLLPPLVHPPLPIFPPPPPPLLLTNGPEEEEEAVGKRDKGSWLDQHVNRMLVSRYYTEVLNSPPKREWKGSNGTISLIRTFLPSISYGKIMQVLNETAICESKGEKYNGMRKNREHKGAYLIPRGSVHERMLCDCIETGLGLNHTALLLNKELKKDGLTEIGVSCLRDSYLRLNPVVIEIRKVPMGTNDAHSPWAKASFNMYKQLAICFDQLDPSITCDPPMPPPLVSIATTNATNVTLDTLAVADIDTLAVAAPTLPPATTALDDARGN